MKVIARFAISFFLIFQFFNFASSITLRRCQKIKNSYQQEVKVTLKLIQVYVVDKDGNSVIDLKQNDFILYDNGKLKTITEFEKHLLALPGKKQEEKKSHLGKPYRSDEVQTKLPLMCRKFVFFFDFAFNDAQGILKAKKAALHFIDTQLHPDDEVGIISYDTFRGIELHEYFTTKHEKIKEIIENFGIRNAIGRAEDIRRDDWANFGSSSSIRDLYKNQVKKFSSNLRDLAQTLRYIPGRKNIIFFSGGVVNSILYGERYKDSNGSGSLRNFYEGMIKGLAASNSTVYSINTSGKGIAHFQDRGDMGDYSLQQLARISGGEYYDNITSYEKINEKIQSSTSFYYVLGYYIDDKWDGKHHRVKVKVKKKGYKILGETGYFNPKLFTKYTELEKLFHLIDLALSKKPLLQEPLHFPVVTLPFSRKGKPNFVAITKIPAEKIKDISGVNMEVVTIIVDGNNNIVHMQKSESSASKLTQESVYFYSFVSLSAGNYECRIVVRNMETGLGAVASSSITIPVSSGSGFMLNPPLLLAPEKKACYIKIKDKSRKDNALSLLDIYPFDPTQYAPIVDELDRDTIKILAIVRCFIGNITEPEIQFSIHFTHLPSGEKVSIIPSFISQFRENENQIFFMEFPVGKLQRGKYSLNIMAEELKTKSKSQVHSEIHVK